MPSQAPVKVLIVDDHIGIRRGISSVMNAEWPRISCVGAVGTPDEALRLAEERQPHVVVLDVNLGDVDGLTLIPSLKGLARCEIVVLTSLSDPRVAARARRLGAHACMNKTAPAAELVAAVFEAYQASNTTSANAGGALSRSVGSKHPSAQGNCADADNDTDT
jgi:DNA-binding NarL/FixJ family response regulator